MKAQTFWSLIFLLVVLGFGPSASAGWLPPMYPNDPNGVGLNGIVAVMGADQVAEVRLGLQYGPLEGYVAPRYDTSINAAHDVLTDLRLYAIYNAIDAAMVANWLNGSVTLPDGAAYAGLYVGWEFDHGDIETGYLLGVRIEIDDSGSVQLSLCPEYQYSWQTWRGDDDVHAFYFGPHIRFK